MREAEAGKARHSSREEEGRSLELPSTTDRWYAS